MFSGRFLPLLSFSIKQGELAALFECHKGAGRGGENGHEKDVQGGFGAQSKFLLSS